MWNPWTEWTACTEKCIAGTQTRQRVCNNPPSTYGGRPCVGNSTETITCGPCKFTLSK